MSRPCYIGLDVGLTATKAAAFDASGVELAVVSARTPRSAETARSHNIDMNLLAQRVLDVLRDLVEALRGQGYEPRGLGVTGHGNGLYPVDAALNPVGFAISSSDSRARHIVDAIPSERAQAVRRLTGSIPWAAQPAVLLRWLRDHQPEAYTQTRWVLACKDWIVTRLTGEVSADYSDASACGLVDLNRRQYASEALELLGLPAADVERFPPMRPSGDVVAPISAAVASQTGLPAGLPVVAGCMDCVASTVGAGGVGLGDATVIVGTWAINGVVAPATQPAPEVTLSALMPDVAHMLAMEVSPTSAANLDWLTYALASTTATEPMAVPGLLAEAATVPAGSDGLLFLPFINGAPEYPAASGTFLGLSPLHRRGHLVRAVLEGIAQYHRRQFDRLVGTGFVAPDRAVRLAGGGAKSLLWAQIFADVLRRPVQRQETSELGARGVASLVANALDQAGTWAAEQSVDLIVNPSPEQEVYAEHAERFDRCLEAMPAVWTILDKDPAA